MNKEKEGEEPDANSGKMVTKKMYYLACLSCRYTTRDVGISDQPSQTFCSPEQEYKHGNRFNAILEHYQSVVLHEKQTKEDEKRRKTTSKSKYPSMTVSCFLNLLKI
jgi:dynactin 4